MELQCDRVSNSMVGRQSVKNNFYAKYSIQFVTIKLKGAHCSLMSLRVIFINSQNKVRLLNVAD